MKAETYGLRNRHSVLIRDALNRHFGGEKTARNQLGLTHKEWSDLGRIANKDNDLTGS